MAAEDGRSLSCQASKANPGCGTVRPEFFAQNEAAMWNPVFLTAALALGQPGAALPDIAPAPPPPPRTAAPMFQYNTAQPLGLAAPEPPPAPDQPPTPITINAPLLPPPAAP